MTGKAGLDPLSRFVNRGARRNTLDFRELDPPRTPEGGTATPDLWKTCGAFVISVTSFTQKTASPSGLTIVHRGHAADHEGASNGVSA